MERTKQPQNVKRRRQWMGRIGAKGPLKKRTENRQDRANFHRNTQGKGYLPGPRGDRMKALHQRRREAAKRAKASRKRNR